MESPSPNIDGPRLRWLQGVPSGAFWLLEGVLVTLLAVCILFARREDVTVDAILAPYPKVAATAPPEAREERAIQAMHAVHELLWPRLKSLDASGVGTDFWFRSTYSHLMAPTGHCGSFAQVLARALQRDGYDVKIAQMRVGDVWGGHIYVVADVGDRWIALDPYFDVAFRGQDGRVLGPSEIKDDWEQVRSQCPPGYNPSYRYEAVRYTNWRGVPMDILGSFFGRISVRAKALNLYWLVVWVCAAALAVSIPLHLLHRRLARLARPADRSIAILFDEIMGELRQLSALYMKTHPPEVTLQPTVIVGEAFVRLAKHKPEDFKDENDFRATAAAILREVFAERAKKRLDQKKRESARSDRGKDEDIGGFPGSSPELFLALEAALRELAEQDRRAARVAELRIFGSLPLSVVASIVGVTTDVAERDWRFAQAYLKKHTEGRAEQA